MDASDTVRELLSQGYESGELHDVATEMVNAACDAIGLDVVMEMLSAYAEACIETLKTERDQKIWNEVKWHLDTTGAEITRTIYQ